MGTPPLTITPIAVDAQTAASMLGISKTTWWELVKNKQAPAPIRFGRATRWRVVDLHAHAAALAAMPTTTP